MPPSSTLVSGPVSEPVLGARLRGPTATQRSKKGSEKVLGKGSQQGSEKGVCYVFCRRKSSEKGSQKGL